MSLHGLLDAVVKDTALAEAVKAVIGESVKKVGGG